MGRQKNTNRHITREEPAGKDAPREEMAAPIVSEKAEGSFNPPQDQRLRKKYKVPTSCRARSTDPYWLIMRELTVSELSEAAKVAEAVSSTTSGFEVAKLGLEAICRDPAGVTGWQTINHAAAQHDEIWGRLSSKVRTLAVQGTKDINMTSDAEDEAFLESAEEL